MGAAAPMLVISMIYFSKVLKLSQMFSIFIKCCQIFSNCLRSSQSFPICLNISQIFSKILRNSQFFSHIPLGDIKTILQAYLFAINLIFEVPRPQTGKKTMFFMFIKYRFFKWPYLDKYEDLEGRTGTDLHLFSSPIVLDRFWAPLK